VNVKRYAAKVARREVVEVTGNPAPASLLKLVASHAAARALAFEPGAAGSFGEPKVEADSLPRGKRTLAAIPVKVAGQGLISAQLTAPVEIVNRPLDYKAAGGLFYSNNPERVTQYGTLFAGRLDLDARHRLFYHHQNMMGKHMRLVIELINSGDGPAEVQTVSGTAPPHIDPVIGGYLAGMSFMRDYLGDIGRIHKIPGQTKLVLYSEVVGETRTASGIIDMRMLEGQDVFVKVSAAPDVSGQLSEGEMASVAAADVPTTLSDHVYSAPFKQVSASYTIGDRWEFVRIGKYAIKNGAGNKELYGNYGVIYEISIHMENPTADTRTVKILFEPTAGPASGIFVVNGQIVAVKVINPPNEFQITSVKLAPGQSKDLKITTIPLGGSAYPATILVKS
jgi:hypothetical protein